MSKISDLNYSQHITLADNFKQKSEEEIYFDVDTNKRILIENNKEESNIEIKKKSKDKKNKAPKKEKADDTVAVETVKKDVDSDDMVAGAVQAIEAIEKNDEESVVEDKVE